MDENEKQVEKLIDFTKKTEIIPCEEVCKCQCSCSAESQAYIVDVKEPLSAPFWFCVMLAFHGFFMLLANKSLPSLTSFQFANKITT